MIRKVEWATEFFIQEGGRPTRLQLTVKATVRNAAGQAPTVQNAINMAMAKLEAISPRRSPVNPIHLDKRELLTTTHD